MLVHQRVLTMHPMAACDHRYTLRHLLIFLVRRVRKNATVEKGSVDVSDLTETASQPASKSQFPKKTRQKITRENDAIYILRKQFKQSSFWIILIIWLLTNDEMCQLTWLF